MGKRAAEGKEVGGRNGLDGGNKRLDRTAVFIRGLPSSATDPALRSFFEQHIGPVSTCFAIKEDYGLVKFKEEADAHRCLAAMQGVEFEGSPLQLEVGKPKNRQAGSRGMLRRGLRPVAAADATADFPQGSSSSSTAPAGGSTGSPASNKQQRIDLRAVQLTGLPAGLKKESLQSKIEELLPGGCGIESVRRTLGQEGSYVISFRKELNAKRAVKTLHGADIDGHKATAGFRALELSSTTAKAGRLIVRNLSFGATEKGVRKAFQKLGALTEVHLPKKPGADPASSQHRGFGFVQFADRNVAEKALQELNGTTISGRRVVVDWAVDINLYNNLKNEASVPQEEPRAAAPKRSATPAEQPQAKRKEKATAEKAETAKEAKRKESATAAKAEAAKEDDGEGDEENATAKEENERLHKEIGRMKSLLKDSSKKKKGVEKKAKDGEQEEEEEEKEGDGEKKTEDKGKREEPSKPKHRDPGFDINQKRTLFVRNIPFDATEEDLRGVLRKFGLLTNVKFMADSTGANPHRGSAFIKFKEAEGAARAMQVEAEAERKLKELSSVVRKGDKKELPAVEGFGISLKGRRLVLREAVTPEEAEKIIDEKKPQKGAAKAEREQWKHLATVGAINQGDPSWDELSKSEKSQRMLASKERKFRMQNSNFTIHPQRLSIRNLPRHVDVTKLREKIAEFLSTQSSFISCALSKKRRVKAAQEAITQAKLVRSDERRDDKGARRSCGFGFATFKDHESAMAVLNHMNNNPEVFGGKNRPIVAFAIEDKRKLRQIQDMKAKVESKQAEMAKDGRNGFDAKAKKKKWAKKPGEEKKQSRGARQREKRRAAKATSEAKAKEKKVKQANYETHMERRREGRVAEQRMRMLQKRTRKNIPDAGVPSNKRPKVARPGQLSDDFELRAMENFRRGRG